jgi:fructose/tagatose bisphosphate aldolase
VSNHLVELLNLVGNSVDYENGSVIINDSNKLQSSIHNWVRVSTLEKGPLQRWARYLVRLTALELGIIPASIHELYMAFGRGEIDQKFTVPALNLRVLSFTAAKAAFKVAQSINSSAFIFEIARSEIGYTGQQPVEFATNILAAAIATGYKGPVFIQGDHYQVSLKKYEEDPKQEINKIKDLILQSINAGFFNIDIDTSTLVDITKNDIAEQQKLNIELSANFTNTIRRNEPDGLTISIGGEIGEVGGRNSTEEDLTEYVQGYKDRLLSNYSDIAGLSKISIQTGTSHGGIVLPDGSIAKVNVDFNTLRDLSRVARRKFGLGGTVQHGASTLPEDAFGKFVEFEAVEVHLATNFMNMFYDNVPQELLSKMYAYLDENFHSSRKSDMTDEQFYYKTRKYAIGPFKKDIYLLNETFKIEMERLWFDKFSDLFHSLNIKDTRKFVDEIITKVQSPITLEYYLGTSDSEEDVSDLAD